MYVIYLNHMLIYCRFHWVLVVIDPKSQIVEFRLTIATTIPRSKRYCKHISLPQSLFSCLKMDTNLNLFYLGVFKFLYLKRRKDLKKSSSGWLLR